MHQLMIMPAMTANTNRPITVTLTMMVKICSMGSFSVLIPYLLKYSMLKLLIAIFAALTTLGLGVLMILAQHWILFSNSD